MKVGKVMKVLKKFLILFIFVVSFGGAEKVMADTEVLSCDYGVICKYSLSGITRTAGGYNYTNAYFGVYYQCSDNSKSLSECSSFTSQGYVSLMSYSANSVAEELTISNSSDVFGSVTTSFKDHFSSNNQFMCPTIYYKGGSVSVSFYYQSNLPAIGSSNIKTAALKENWCIEQNSTVDWNSIIEEVDAGAANSGAELYNNESGDDIRDSDDDDSDGSIIEKIVAWGSSTLGLDYDLSSDSCSLISAEVREFLGDVFSYMSIIGIVILVIMTGINVVKVITASEDDALKGFLKNLWKRIVCLIILLLLPMLVTFIIQVVNGVADIWGVNSDDPLCSITE